MKSASDKVISLSAFKPGNILFASAGVTAFPILDKPSRFQPSITAPERVPVSPIFSQAAEATAEVLSSGGPIGSAYDSPVSKGINYSHVF